MPKAGYLFVKHILVTATFFCGVVNSAQITVVTEHLAPFQIVNEGIITGLSTEIVEKVLDTSEIDYTIEAHPWALSYHRAKQVKNTCIYSISKIPEREDFFQWIGHIVKSTISIYSLATNSIEISSLEEAKAYQVAVIREDVTHHFLLSKGFVEGDNLYVMDNYDTLLALLEKPSRNIDFVLLNDDLIYHRVKSADTLSKYKNVYSLSELTFDFYLACSLSTDAKIIKNLTETMSHLEEEQSLEVIRNKWKAQMKDVL